jgi:Helix-turn-helix domain
MADNVERGTSQTSETRQRVSDSVYDSWLTKQEAADRIGGSTKMVERLAAEGKIQQASTQREGRGAFRTVYHPDDVARIARERQPGATAFVLPVGVTPPSNGNGHHASTALQIAEPAPAPGDDVLRLVFAAALRAVSETSETRVALFVSIPEAAAITGLRPIYLRRAIADGRLPAVQDRGWKIRRKDLEAL